MTERQRARLESAELKELIRRVDMEDLPVSHRKLAETVGIIAALRLCEAVGGREITIPVPLETKHSGGTCRDADDFPAAHRLYAEIMGADAALKLFAVFGREQLYIPKNDRVKAYIRRLDIHEAYYGEGMTASEIAADFQITERTVQRVISMRLDEIKA